MKSSEHFTEKELRCSHCKEAKMDADFMGVLESIRSVYGKTIKLSSAYRCSMWNKAVSNSGLNGPHTTGKAVDIKCSGKEAHELLQIIIEHDIPRIGISQKGAHHKRFIHIDILTDDETQLSPWIWTY